MEVIRNIPDEMLYYIDECGIDQYLHRTHGYSVKGVAILGEINGKKYKRTNVVAAQCCKKIVAPLAYEGTTDSVLFECWFEKMLLESVPSGSVLVMDNASFHRKKKLAELAEKSQCIVLFLPPYSPDLNPIENFWAWLKQRLRSVLQFHDNFDDVLSDCFQLV
jgi:transposase